MEQSLNSTPGLDVMRSKTVPGLSSITLFFKRGTDSLEARQLVNERVAIAIPSLPASAGIPWVLQPLSATSRALKIGLTTDPLQPHRPVDDRLLDDPLAADGGARRRQRERLGRPLEAAPAAVRPGEAARSTASRIDDAQSVRLRRARLRPAQVHRRGQEPGGRVHRDAPTSASASTTSCPVFTPARPGRGHRRATGARPTARRSRSATWATMTWGHQPLFGDAVINDGPGPHARGREVPVGEHARRDARRRQGARRAAARPARRPDRHPHLPAGDVHRASRSTT